MTSIVTSRPYACESGSVASARSRPGTCAALCAERRAEQLIAWAREHIGGYMYPRDVHIVDALPLTAVGKIDRKSLRARAVGGPDHGAPEPKSG